MKLPMPNFIDRAVSFISPERGLRRMKARANLALSFGIGGNRYKGASKDGAGRKTWLPFNSSPDADLEGERDTLISRSRDLMRNEPHLAGAVGTVSTNTVGDGLRLKAQPDYELLGITPEESAAWSRRVESLFGYFGKECHHGGCFRFGKIQNLAFESALVNGDVLAILPYSDPKKSGGIFGTRIQLVEADLVSNPNYQPDTDQIRGGVEYQNGVPVAYYVADKYPGDFGSACKWTRYTRFNSGGGHRVLLLANIKRVNSSRGEPWFAPVIDAVKALGDYREVEIKAAIINAFYNVFIERDPQAAALAVDITPTEAAKPQELKLGHGAVHELAPGERIGTLPSTRPNSVFDPFTAAILRSIGSALNLPYEMLVSHFSASYSASRAAMLMAWSFFKRRRTWLAEGFCDPIYHNWLDEAVSSGRVVAPGYFEDPLIRAAWRKSAWQGEAMPQLDPLKESAAIGNRLGARVTTLDEEIGNHTGGDFASKYPQLKQEAERLAELDQIRTPANPGPGPDPSEDPDRSDREEAAA